MGVTVHGAMRVLTGGCDCAWGDEGAYRWA